jgi:DNA-binding protein YbaB
MQAGQESDLATMSAELDSMQQTLQERQKKLDAHAVDLGAATE